MYQLANQHDSPLTASNPFTAYGQSAVATDAAYLKFVKGEFRYGVDNEILAIGTKLVPNMPEFQAGHMKWWDGKPVKEVMVRIADGQSPSRREDLGDLDESLWQLDRSGTRRDPWQFCNRLPFKNPETGDEYVFTTSSDGGIKAIGSLCRAYGDAKERDDGKLPVVEMCVSSYRHKSYGEVHYPVFHIVTWADEAKLIAGEPAETSVADELDDAIPF